MGISLEAKRGGEKVVRSDAFEVLARAGFVARGLIYVLIGILALKLAFGNGGGHQANQQGAMRAIAQQPFGKVLLTLVAIGLAGYSLWRLTRALLGHGKEASDGTLDRAAAFASFVGYGILAVVAVEILAGSSSSQTPHKAAAGVFGWPAGTWLVGIAGVATIGVALYQGYRGVTRDFLNDSKTGEMSPTVKSWITWIGTIGHLARFVVFGLIGIFLIKAAVDFSAKKAVGLDGALAKLAAASYGPFLVGLVAAGLVAFGVYSLSDARFRRI